MSKKAYQIELGKHLRKQRLAKNLSTSQLANRCESVDKFMISRIENGNQNPTVYTVLQLIKGMDMNIDEFFKDFDY